VSVDVALDNTWWRLAGWLKGKHMLSEITPRRHADGDAVAVRFVNRPAIRVGPLRSAAGALADSRRLLIAATDVQALREVVETEGGLAATDGFRRVVARLPSGRSAFIYVDVPGVIRWGFEPFARAVIDAVIPGAGTRLDRQTLPDVWTAALSLEPMGVAFFADDGGVRVEGVTPIGLVPTAGFVAVTTMVGAQAVQGGAVVPDDATRPVARPLGPPGQR